MSALLISLLHADRHCRLASDDSNGHSDVQAIIAHLARLAVGGFPGA